MAYIVRNARNNMQKRDRLCLILHYFIEHSKKISARKRFYCLKSSDFKIIKAVGEGYEVDQKTGKMKKLSETHVLFDLSRKKFDNIRDDLLERKFITEIPASDGRSNYYSITPLGILFFVKNDYVLQQVRKIKSDLLEKIFLILESFANQYVTPYRSEIFVKDKWDFVDFYKSSLIKTIGVLWIRSRVYSIFNQIKISERGFIEFGYELLFERPVIIELAKFQFIKNEILLEELSRGRLKGKLSKYKLIKLSDEQFHNYLSKLIMCIIVHQYFLVEQILDKKTKPYDWSKIPDNIQLILQVFNFRIGKYFHDNQRDIISLIRELK